MKDIIIKLIQEFNKLHPKNSIRQISEEMYLYYERCALLSEAYTEEGYTEIPDEVSALYTSKLKEKGIKAE